MHGSWRTRLAGYIMTCSAVFSNISAFMLAYIGRFYQCKPNASGFPGYTLICYSLICFCNTDLKSSLSLYISYHYSTRCTRNFLTSPDDAPEFRTENLWKIILFFPDAALTSSLFGYTLLTNATECTVWCFHWLLGNITSPHSFYSVD